MNVTIVVEIPHHFPATVWLADDDDKIIDIAMSDYDLSYERITREGALQIWGEEDMPDELDNIFMNSNEAVEITYGLTEGSIYYKVGDAPSKLEAAKEAIGYDLQSCYFLTFEEAKQFVTSYKGHQYVKARALVENLLWEIQ